MADLAPFCTYGGDEPSQPLIISVPHAGRHYPDAMTAMLRLRQTQLLPLEDRYADRLAAAAFAEGLAGIVANTARAWIDLNRDEAECDPALVDLPADSAPLLSAKLRGGLGLIPRRIAPFGDIWRHRIAADDLALRIADHHRPYHAALDRMLSAAQAKFGIALLLDVHSMPTLRPSGDDLPPQIVIGDSFGRTAHDRFTACAVMLAAQYGLRVAVNHPYAGGYVLKRHARPGGGRHALQIEIDRSLYLDSTGAQPGSGMVALQRFIAALARALIDEALQTPQAIAAE